MWNLLCRQVSFSGISLIISRPSFKLCSVRCKVAFILMLIESPLQHITSLSSLLNAPSLSYVFFTWPHGVKASLRPERAAELVSLKAPRLCSLLSPRSFILHRFRLLLRQGYSYADFWISFSASLPPLWYSSPQTSATPASPESLSLAHQLSEIFWCCFSFLGHGPETAPRNKAAKIKRHTLWVSFQWLTRRGFKPLFQTYCSVF